MLGLLDGATQLKDNGGTRPDATVARRWQRQAILRRGAVPR
jgi:hypothetical protein